jgi:hypothetical protein
MNYKQSILLCPLVIVPDMGYHFLYSLYKNSVKYSLLYFQFYVSVSRVCNFFLLDGYPLITTLTEFIFPH